MPLRRWARSIVTMLLLVAIVATVGPQQIQAALGDVQIVPLLAAALFTLPLMAVKMLRWGLLVREEQTASALEIVTSYLMGLSLSVITPAGAGEAARATFLPGRRAALTGKAVLDKLIDLYALCLLAGLGLVAQGELAVLGLLVLLCLAAAALLAVWVRRQRLTPTLPLAPLQRGLEGILSTSSPVLASNILLALLSFTILYGQLFMVLVAFGAKPPPHSALVYPLITLSTILPVTISGVGIREWAGVLVLAPFGLQESVVFNAVFVHFIISTVLPALVGLSLWGSAARRG